MMRNILIGILVLIFIGLMGVFSVTNDVSETQVISEDQDENMTASLLPYVKEGEFSGGDIVHNQAGGYEQGGATVADPIQYPFRDWVVREPELIATLALAVDLNSGFVFYQKGRSDRRWPIASISKLITALVLRDNTVLDEPVIISAEAVSTEGIAGYLKEGDIYSVEDLTELMIMLSSNDAAMALSEYIGKDSFMGHMQRKAVAIGMHESAFVEPTGLSNVNQATTNDLKKLIEYIHQTDPDLLYLSSQKSANVYNRKDGTERTILNINHFSGFSNFLGGKTGYLDESGENLLALFRYKDYLIATIVLGSSDRYGETDKILDFIKEGYKF